MLERQILAQERPRFGITGGEDFQRGPREVTSVLLVGHRLNAVS